MLRAPIFCGASARKRKPLNVMRARCNWPLTKASAASWNGGSAKFSRRIRCRFALRVVVLLLLPAAAQRLVDLHQGQQFVEAGLREAEVSGQVICFVGENFQIIGGAGFVALA